MAFRSEQKESYQPVLTFNKVEFVISVHSLLQLPEPVYPEVAFAGRSNVGKSSLLNSLLKRHGMVKTSSKPGKTQGLNYFNIDGKAYMVDLPGYGFARVSRKMQKGWQDLITGYLLERESLQLVVVVIDLRHELKKMDRDLIDWLIDNDISCLPVYTKADKLSKSNQGKNAASLDAALGIRASDRVIFSAKSGQGRDALLAKIESCCGLRG